MSENMKQMRERHKIEIEELQKNCTHENVSDWMKNYWAIAHQGPSVKRCLFCEKIMEEQVWRSDSKQLEEGVIEVRQDEECVKEKWEEYKKKKREEYKERRKKDE